MIAPSLHHLQIYVDYCRTLVFVLALTQKHWKSLLEIRVVVKILERTMVKSSSSKILE